jgi:hypothetical protein
MIESNRNFRFLIRNLRTIPACRWLAPLPADTIEGPLFGPAALASWVAEKHRVLLDKPSIGVLVLGNFLDAVDEGRWWSLLPTMLGKPSGWARVEVVVATEEAREARSFGRIAPLSLATSKVTCGDLSVLTQMPPDGIDIVFCPMTDGRFFCQALLNDVGHGWAFLESGAMVVAAIPQMEDVETCQQLADVFGLECRSIPNRFNIGAVDKSSPGIQIDAFVGMSGGRPEDFDQAARHAFCIETVLTTVADIRDSISHRAASDYRLWGMKCLLKSSVDSSDQYMTLPNSLVVRERTGKIYTIEDDLVVSEARRPQLTPASVAAHPGQDAPWYGRAAWACAVWQAGLGEDVENTLGGYLGLQASDVKKRVTEMFEDIDPRQAATLSKAFFGDAPRTPNRDERILLDLVDAGDEHAVTDALQSNPNLIGTRTADHEPLLVVLAIAKMFGAMEQAIRLGASVNAVDDKNRPLIIDLATRAPVEALTLALRKGANPNASDMLGWTALTASMRQGKWASVMALLDHGADPRITNSMNESALTIARGDVSAISEIAETALAGFAERHDMDLKSLLRKQGLMLDSADIPEDIRRRLLVWQPGG